MERLKFVDQDHKDFYEKFVPKIGNDVYFKPVVYLLGLCADTRNNFKSVLNPEAKEISLDGLKCGWQTGTSMKITRLAFNLWNGMTCDSHDDFKDSKISSYYAVDEIFCCGYAPYFYEAIKLRYPEYCGEE
jgi:hypothetical protein